MDTELATILKTHKSKARSSSQKNEDVHLPSFSDIPDVFFEDVLQHFRLNRIEICLLLSLYRSLWCRPNLYKKYGISPMLSYHDLKKELGVSMEELHSGLKNLESLGLIETIRLGQYFIRRFFTEKWDNYYGQSYDDF